MSINGAYKLYTPAGEVILPLESMTYLGATYYAGGTLKRELNRKWGAAWWDPTKPNRLWKHTSLTRSRKLLTFQAVVLSRLLYGLSSAWLNVADVRRLCSFHCRCLRVICRVQPAFLSRVSNKKVSEESGQRSLAKQLLQQQMLLYRRVAGALPSDPLRSLAFVLGGLEPAMARYIRRGGRPRNE